MSELAKRAIACKGWRWLPGMRTQHHGRVIDGTGVAVVDGSRLIAPALDRAWTVPAREVAALPDLSDAATLGALLALVREAWGCDSLTCQPLLPLVGVHGWRVVGTSAKSGHTEAEALVAALEAAP